jgi:hypothetical protein
VNEKKPPTPLHLWWSRGKKKKRKEKEKPETKKGLILAAVTNNTRNTLLHHVPVSAMEYLERLVLAINWLAHAGMELLSIGVCEPPSY